MPSIYRRIVTALPTLEQIDAQADARFPDDPDRRNTYSDGCVRGYYLGARTTLEVMVARLEECGKLLDPPPDDEDDDETGDFDHGGEAIEGLEVPPLTEVDDETIDYGKRIFIPTTDETRCMRGAKT